MYKFLPMLRLYAFLAVFGCLLSCGKAVHSAPPAASPSPAPAPLPPHPGDTTSRRFLALGDSYTIGQSVQPADRFPAQTAAGLQKNGIRALPPEYIATTGWTTYDLQQGIAAAKPAGPYDIVTLLIGVNDQYQHLDTAAYRTRFTRLLQQAVQLAGNNPKHVFVLSIPDYSVTPFGQGSQQISDEISLFNNINRAITLANNISYTDITVISRNAAHDPSLTAPDGLHPSGKQYQLWADALVYTITRVFQE